MLILMLMRMLRVKWRLSLKRNFHSLPNVNFHMVETGDRRCWILVNSHHTFAANKKFRIEKLPRFAKSEGGDMRRCR